jgi:hypothetical protein
VARATAVEPRFAVAFVPRRNADAPPAYAATDDGTATTLVLDWGPVRDVVVFDPSQTPTAGDVETDATVALVRRTGGIVTGWLAGDGTLLREGGTDVVRLDGRASIALAGDVLHVSRADVGFTAWAPGITTVEGPSGPLLFHRDGDYVFRAASSDAAPAEGATWIEPPHPNPTGGTSFARFALARAAHVRARIVDVRGTTVATLLDAPAAAGVHRVSWDGTDAGRRRAAAGVYFLQIEVAGWTTTRKLVRAR